MNKLFFTIAILSATIALASCGSRRNATTVTETIITNTATTDKGVVINGVRWATRNVGMPGTFVDDATDAGMFYQWNSREAWNVTDREVANWNTAPAVGMTWERTNDPCPPGWRVPTNEELRSLMDSGSVSATIDGVSGRTFGTAPNQLFLPAAGWRDITTGILSNEGTNGLFWSSTPRGELDGEFLQFNCSRSLVTTIFRTSGFSVRCVEK